MTYNDLIVLFKGLDKKDTYLTVNDQTVIEARLGYANIPMTRYDNGKLVQRKPDIRVSGQPIQDLPERVYLCIFSTPSGHGEYSRKNTVDIPSTADKWVEYLESLPDQFRNQEVIFFSRGKGFGANAEASMKGGVGLNVVGIAVNPETGRTNISREEKRDLDKRAIDYYCQETGYKPCYWEEAIIFDMTRESWYNDRRFYQPYA